MLGYKSRQSKDIRMFMSKKRNELGLVMPNFRGEKVSQNPINNGAMGGARRCT